MKTTVEKMYFMYIQVTVEEKNFLRFYMYRILKKGDLCFKGHIFIFIKEDL